MLFLANKLSKMKQGTRLGSRIAEIHNGSSLFTGSAGQGESNIRRWIIENDWLEAIVALPLNMFYKHRHRHLRLGAHQPEARAPEGPGAADRSHEVVPTAPEESWEKELRAWRGGHREDLPDVPRFRGDRGEQDLRQRGVRVLEGDRWSGRCAWR